MFNPRRNLYLMLALVIVISTMLGACAGAATPAPAPAAAAPTTTPGETVPAAAAPAAAAPTTAAPAASDADKYGGVAIETSQDDAESFDPPAAWATIDWIAVNRLLYNALYRYDAKSQIVPDLADGQPQVSADGLVWTIKLKTGVKFTNGREFVADDVKYTLERNATPDSGTWDTTDPMSNVVGGQDIVDGKATTADGIKVIDPHTVQFTAPAPRCLLPRHAHADHQPHRAQGRGGKVGQGLRLPPGRHRPLYVEGLDAKAVDYLRAQSELFRARPALPGRHQV